MVAAPVAVAADAGKKAHHDERGTYEIKNVEYESAHYDDRRHPRRPVLHVVGDERGANSARCSRPEDF